MCGHSCHTLHTSIVYKRVCLLHMHIGIHNAKYHWNQQLMQYTCLSPLKRVPSLNVFYYLNRWNVCSMLAGFTLHQMKGQKKKICSTCDVFILVENITCGRATFPLQPCDSIQPTPPPNFYNLNCLPLYNDLKIINGRKLLMSLII